MWNISWPPAAQVPTRTRHTEADTRGKHAGRQMTTQLNLPEKLTGKRPHGTAHASMRKAIY